MPNTTFENTVISDQIVYTERSNKNVRQTLQKSISRK
jgi:hypothetical protein